MERLEKWATDLRKKRGMEVKEGRVKEEREVEELEKKEGGQGQVRSGKVAARVCGALGCGGHPRPALGPCRPPGPPYSSGKHPPPPPPGESHLDSPVYFASSEPPVDGGGGYEWMLGGSLRMGRCGLGGGGEGEWHWRLQGVNMGRPSGAAVKTFELAQFNVFTPRLRRLVPTTNASFAPVWGHCAWRGWRLRLQVMRVGRFDQTAANRGAYGGLIRGTASRPKALNKPAAAAAKRAPQPLTPRKAFRKALRAI